MSRHTYEWDMSHTWTRHVVRTSASPHTDAFVSNTSVCHFKCLKKNKKNVSDIWNDTQMYQTFLFFEMTHKMTHRCIRHDTQMHETFHVTRMNQIC